MDSIKNNKVLATLFWVAIAGAVGLGVFAYLSYGTYQQSLLDLGSMNTKLARVEGAALYPSQENVEKLATNVNEYEDSVGKLTQVLLHLQTPAEPILDTEFQAKLKEAIATTKADAEKAKMGLPKVFNLGFDKYTGDLPKSPEASRQLNDYFQSVNAIVQACIKSGVASIDTLTRSEIEVEKPDAPVVKPSAAQEKRMKSKSRAKAKAAAPAAEMTKVTERRQVHLDLTLDQPAYTTLLNTLADANLMPYFTVVRLAHVENEKQDGPPRSLALPAVTTKEEPAPAPPPAAGADGEAPAAPKEEVIPVAKADSPDSLAVMGHEKLKVHLQIDIIRFQEAVASK